MSGVLRSLRNLRGHANVGLLAKLNDFAKSRFPGADPAQWPPFAVTEPLALLLGDRPVECAIRRVFHDDVSADAR